MPDRRMIAMHKSQSMQENSGLAGMCAERMCPG